MDEKSPLEPEPTKIVDDVKMATLVAPPPPPPALLDQTPPPNNTANVAGSGVNKRYRPAPAKTFQCRGYGDCRMVFSRSEHLARHIRKHTGERPFSCHCGKQFSRLDNLRQHAQTVHADKQELNDKMMRDLTSLHATMTAATKGGSSRVKRPSLSGGNIPNTSSPTDSASPTDGEGSIGVKQEDVPQSIPSQHPRPGTSTGYEGDNGIIYQQIPGSSAWHPNSSTSNPRSQNSYSFRDSLTNQSFRTSPYFGQYPAGQSFLAPSSFGTSAINGSSHGRTLSDARSLPPIAAVVSSSLAPSPPLPSHSTYLISQPPPPTATGSANVLPLPTPTIHRRPATSASRPTTAPASYYYPAAPPGSSHARQLPFQRTHGPGLGFSGSELLIPVYGSSKLGHGGTLGSDDGPTSPTTGESPFSFHPPALSDTPLNPRKRPFPGSDDDSLPNANAEYEYEYGTESRPQSRRLTVMELCNDLNTPPRTASGESRPGSRAFLPALSAPAAEGDDRPRTSSGALFAADPAAAGRADASRPRTRTPSPRAGGDGRGGSRAEDRESGSGLRAGRRLLQTFGDGDCIQSTYSSCASVFPTSRSPSQDVRAAAGPRGAAGGSGGVGASRAGRESPGSDQVRITAGSGFAPLGMKA